MKLFIVDDETESRTLFAAILTTEGYEVRAADGGELALASLAVDRPELILLDIRMRSRTFFETLTRSATVTPNPMATIISQSVIVTKC